MEWKRTSFCKQGCRNFLEITGCSKLSPDCDEEIKNWLEEEVELTADEMFEELGYEITRQNPHNILYIKKERLKCAEEIYFVKTIKEEWEYEKYYIGCDDNPQHPLLIREKEHKAICKKLEELKEEGNERTVD